MRSSATCSSACWRTSSGQGFRGVSAAGAGSFGPNVPKEPPANPTSLARAAMSLTSVAINWAVATYSVADLLTADLGLPVRFLVRLVGLVCRHLPRQDLLLHRPRGSRLDFAAAVDRLLLEAILVGRQDEVRHDRVAPTKALPTLSIGPGRWGPGRAG